MHIVTIETKVNAEGYKETDKLYFVGDHERTALNEIRRKEKEVKKKVLLRIMRMDFENLHE